MTKLAKLAQKFIKQPCAVSYKDMHKLLLAAGFVQVNTKGSHVKFKHDALNLNIIVPVHNAECKDFYKKDILKTTKLLITKIK